MNMQEINTKMRQLKEQLVITSTKNTPTFCLRCNKKTITNKGRGLCLNCYNYIYNKKELSKYPKIYSQFIQNLSLKYGPKIILDFYECSLNLTITLKTISKKYGFSTARAGQIAVLFYGEGGYLEARKKRRRELDLQKRRAHFHPHIKSKNTPSKKGSKEAKYAVGNGYLTERIVWDALLARGYQPTYPLRRSPYDLEVNTNKIEIKGSFHSLTTSPKTKIKYYLCMLTERERKAADFIIIYIHPTTNFYIIPIEKIKGLGIYIRDNINSIAKTAPNATNNWEKCKNNWKVLDIK